MRWLSFIVALCLSVPSLAQGLGIPDLAFGTNGFARIDTEEDEYCRRVATDPSGNIFVAGQTLSYAPSVNQDYLLVKLLPSGQPDASFAQNGVLRGDFPSVDLSRMKAVFPHSDGYAYVLGEGRVSSLPDSQWIFLGRVDAYGNLDSTFGNQGWYSEKYEGNFAEGGELSVDSQGRIAFCGMSLDTISWHLEMPLMGRLLPNGTPDSSFGGTGALAFKLPGGLHTQRAHADGGLLTSMVPYPNGRMLYGGSFFLSNNAYGFLILLEEDGQAVPDFGDNGVRVLDISPGYHTQFQGLALTAQGLAAAAWVDNPNGQRDFYLYLADSMAQQGQAVPYDFGGEEVSLALAVDPQGRIVMTGNAVGDSADSWVVMSTDIYGNLESGFGQGGAWRSSPFIGWEGGGEALCIAPNGDILVAGTSADTSFGNYRDLVVVRLHGGPLAALVPPTTAEAWGPWPNPFAHRLHAGASEGQPVRLLDLQGRVWLETDAAPEAVDLSELPAGLYLWVAPQGVKRVVKLP